MSWRALVSRTLLCLGASAGAAHAELRELRIGLQYGLTYLPFDVMEVNKSIEARAAAKGMPDLKVTWIRFSGGNVMNDALLSGSIDVAGSGLPAFATLWARARGRSAVKSLGSYGTSSFVMMTRNPAVKSIRDLGDADRIAVSAVKVSTQAILLQMAAEKEFGIGQHDRLDRLTVTRSNPDGAAEILSGKTEINTHFTIPPFIAFERMQPGMKEILKSEDIVGGPIGHGYIYLTEGVHDDNPQLVAALVEAFDEACEVIKKDTRAAAELYMNKTGDKKFGVEPILSSIEDPGTKFDRQPRGMFKVVGFMARTKAIGREPAGEDDMLFKEAPRAGGQ